MIKERACPVCHGTGHVPFAEERIDPERVGSLTYASRKPPEFMCLRLVRCTGCDLVYAPTPPDASFLHAAYAEADFDSVTEAQAAAKTYASALTPHVKNLSARNAAVDVGAGSGPLLPWLQEQGFAPVIGIEPSRTAIQAAAPSVRPLLLEGVFSDELLEEDSSSLICSFMTLEHILDPGKFVSTAHSKLENGGLLAVVVHNWRAPLNRLLGLRSPIIDVEHLQLFSPRSLEELLKRGGFEEIRLLPLRNAYPLSYWLRLTPLPSPAKRVLLALLERVGLARCSLAMNVGNVLAVGVKPGGLTTSNPSMP